MWCDRGKRNYHWLLVTRIKWAKHCGYVRQIVCSQHTHNLCCVQFDGKYEWRLKQSVEKYFFLLLLLCGSFFSEETFYPPLFTAIYICWLIFIASVSFNLNVNFKFNHMLRKWIQQVATIEMIVTNDWQSVDCWHLFNSSSSLDLHSCQLNGSIWQEVNKQKAIEHNVHMAMLLPEI